MSTEIEYEEIVYPNSEPEDTEEQEEDDEPEVYHLINEDVGDDSGGGWHGRLFKDRICRVPLKKFSCENVTEIRGCQMKVEYLAAWCWHRLSEGFQAVTHCPDGLSDLDNMDIKALNLCIEWLIIKESILSAKPVFNDIIILPSRKGAGFDKKTYTPDILTEMKAIEFIEDDRVWVEIIRREN